MKWFIIKNHENQQSSQQLPQKHTRLLPTYEESMCFSLPLYTHDEDHFHHPQILS